MNLYHSRSNNILLSHSFDQEFLQLIKHGIIIIIIFNYNFLFINLNYVNMIIFNKTIDLIK